MWLTQVPPELVWELKRTLEKTPVVIRLRQTLCPFIFTLWDRTVLELMARAWTPSNRHTIHERIHIVICFFQVQIIFTINTLSSLSGYWYDLSDWAHHCVYTFFLKWPTSRCCWVNIGSLKWLIVVLLVRYFYLLENIEWYFQLAKCKTNASI